MDMNVALPKSRITWLATFVLIVWLYILYYTFIYGYLLGFYEKQFYLIPFACTETECITSSLNVTLIVPKYLGGGRTQSFYVNIENTNATTEFAGTLTLVIDDENNFSEKGRLPLLFDDGEGINVPAGGIAEFYLKPHDSVVINIPFVVSDEILNLNEIYLYYQPATGKEEILHSNTSYKNIKINIVNSSFFRLISKIMLPPWANGVIPALGLFSCWFIECYVIECAKTSGNEKNEKKEVSVISIDGIKLIGYFFVLGNLFCLSVIIMFLLSAALNAPSLLIAAPIVLIGLWVSCPSVVTDWAKRIIAALYQLSTLAIMILFLGLISAMQNYDVFRNDFQVFTVMDPEQKAAFALRVLGLVLFYLLLIVIVVRVFLQAASQNNDNKQVMVSPKRNFDPTSKSTSTLSGDDSDDEANGIINLTDESPERAINAAQKIESVESLGKMDIMRVSGEESSLAMSVSSDAMENITDKVIEKMYECKSCGARFFSSKIPPICPTTSCKNDKEIHAVYRCVNGHIFPSPSLPEQCAECDSKEVDEFRSK